jgi:hypothetical protein
MSLKMGIFRGDMSNMKRLIASIAILSLCICTTKALLGADGGTVDKKKVYYGKASSFKKPAEINLLTVFGAISEYTEAKKKSEDDPDYYILLQKANDKFQKALKKAASDGGYDLVAEKGAVKAKKTVPDITDAVIKALPK